MHKKITTGMAPHQSGVITEEELSEADEAILDELQDGARTKGYLVDVTGYHRNTIRHRLEVLEAGDVIRCIHDSTALYELIEDPRESERA
jgi:hypothetical protein